jgi:hypothetical protein
MPQIPILPQQHNYVYILHTSQAETSRAPTQTAHFPRAEESTDNHDNDDGLSWLAVSGRGKRKRHRSTKVTTVMKNHLQETNKPPIHIAITTKSDALRHSETESNAKHERKDPAKLQI